MRNLIIWLILIMTVALFFNSQDGNRFKSVFLPHVGRVQGNGSIEFTKSRDGHFYIQAQINNTNITFLLDTGATDIVLSPKDAVRAGISQHDIESFKTYETAQGRIEAGVARVSQMKIGYFVISDLQVSLNTYHMPFSLLGMSFLQYFDFIIQDNKLILHRE